MLPNLHSNESLTTPATADTLDSSTNTKKSMKHLDLRKINDGLEQKDEQEETKTSTANQYFGNGEKELENKV